MLLTEKGHLEWQSFSSSFHDDDKYFTKGTEEKKSDESKPVEMLQFGKFEATRLGYHSQVALAL